MELEVAGTTEGLSSLPQHSVLWGLPKLLADLYHLEKCIFKLAVVKQRQMDLLKLRPAWST